MTAPALASRSMFSRWIAESGDSRALVSRHDLVRKQDVVAQRRNDLCFTDRRTRQPRARSGGKLTLRDLGGFVCLEVWPDAARPLGKECSHARDVAFEGGRIQYKGGGRNL